jgi:TfoX/Sxy family transcriptional regulator of competence genes
MRVFLMVYDQVLATRVRSLLADRGDVEEKKMFGGITFMVAGQMCCGVLKDDLIVKVDADQSPTLLKQPHVRPFDFSGKPMMGMLYISPPAVREDAALQSWIQRGVEYVVSHPKIGKAKRKT